VRYDARGNGLSDWRPPSITFEDFVADLGTVFDAAAIERAPVLGISQGASVAVAYAARHPERVSALILIGGTARGWRVKHNPRLTDSFEALMLLMRQGWGTENAAFRQIFTTSFFPTGTQAQADWFNELQRKTTSPENAAAILSALGDLDVRAELKQLKVPALVVHSRADAVVPFKDGLELASGIEGARFVALEDANHLLMDGEPGWQRFSAELDAFLRENAL
jgi:pimeloyl-ACP methyl ester carboxylesterase